MDIKVIYEDKNFIVINKPAGLLVHQAQFRRRTSNTEPSLVDWLLKNYPEVKIVVDNPAERPGIVHRLDKDTSGVMVIARNQETFDYLKSLFQKHLVKKVYLALVCGKLIQRQGVIDKPIGIKNGSTKRSVHSQKLAALIRLGFILLLSAIRLPEINYTAAIKIHYRDWRASFYTRNQLSLLTRAVGG